MTSIDARKVISPSEQVWNMAGGMHAFAHQRGWSSCNTVVSSGFQNRR
jgi:hypothetical protein